MHLNMAYIDKQQYSFTKSNQDNNYIHRKIVAGKAAYDKTRIRCIFKSNIAICLKTHCVQLLCVASFDIVVKVVEHTGVREQPEMFSAHEEADTRILLHIIDFATTHSMLIVRCDDTDRLVFLIHYRGKCRGDRG